MTAKTSWFFCGKCGFKNHPRPNADNEKCEQCGEDRKVPEAYDYQPGSAAHA